LSPPVLRELGLVAALQWLAERVASTAVAGLNISVDAEWEPTSLDESLRVLLFQVARELLANVVKHAKARRAVVSLCERDEIVRLTVSDDGVGLNEAPAAAEAPPQPRRATSFGLFNIRERLKHRGGWLEIESTPGYGARFTVAVPVGEGSAAGAAQGSACGAGKGAGRSVGGGAGRDGCRVASALANNGLRNVGVPNDEVQQ
jgi:signal transduction histidine kinase